MRHTIYRTDAGTLTMLARLSKAHWISAGMA